jgi:hypothetical protein
VHIGGQMFLRSARKVYQLIRYFFGLAISVFPLRKHGTWIECWTDTVNGVNRCKLTEMDGTPGYEGIFLANTGKHPVSESDLRIEGEPTSDVTNWVRLGGLRGAPLVFLRNGTVLIPKDAYQDGLAKLEQLYQDQAK